MTRQRFRAKRLNLQPRQSRYVNFQVAQPPRSIQKTRQILWPRLVTYATGIACQPKLVQGGRFSPTSTLLNYRDRSCRVLWSGLCVVVGAWLQHSGQVWARCTHQQGVQLLSAERDGGGLSPLLFPSSSTMSTGQLSSLFNAHALHTIPEHTHTHTRARARAC